MTDKETIEKLELEITRLKNELSDCKEDTNNLMDDLEDQDEFTLEARSLEDICPELFGEKSIIDQQKLEIIFGNGLEKGLFQLCSLEQLEECKKQIRS